MIAGIGTDIVAVERFQRFLDEDNRTLLGRLFTDAELAVCTARRDKASCLAARFAAKEAFLKALGTGLRDGISWLDMQVFNDPLGKPQLIITGRAGEILSARRSASVHLSLSHDGGCATAMVVLEEQ